MPLFGGKKAAKDEGSVESGIVGFTKPKKFLGFKIKSKPVFGGKPSAVPEIPPMAPEPVRPVEMSGQPSVINYKRPDRWQMYFMSVAAKQKGLEDALKGRGIKEAPYEFIKKMFTYAVIVTVVLTVAIALLLWHLNMGPTGLVLAAVLGFALYQSLFNRFVKYPIDASKAEGSNIERDILFAARDLVISMRSGMPLFNAMATVSTGYGAASKEFEKVVELIQLGTPAEQAIDDVSSKSQSKTFKRIMLQASVSIRVGADVAGALQGVVDEVTQERIIELRRYGQRLNVLSMFYMLVGVIFPSMGVAVLVILTTFVNVITITDTTLLFGIVGIFFLQIIFLNIMRSSRPVFAM
jgi:flagellar protein FlaJ